MSTKRAADEQQARFDYYNGVGFGHPKSQPVS